MKKLSRKDALAQGLKRYFTGTPCKHGHIAERLTASHACHPCSLERAKKWRAANKDKVRESNRKQYMKNPEKSRKRVRDYYAENAEARREAGRKDYAKNTEARQESSRKWKNENPEKVREGQRRYYWNNQEKMVEQRRRWREANPEKVKESDRKHYANHPESRKENARKWKAANPERAAENERMWKANNPVTALAIQVRYQDSELTKEQSLGIAKIRVEVNQVTKPLMELRKCLEKQLQQIT